MYHYIEVKGAINEVWWPVGPEFNNYDDVLDYLSTMLEGVDGYRITSYPQSILVDYPYLDDEEC